MKSDLRVVVNADDLGISERVNDSIFEYMGKGLVTSATILANGEAVRGASTQSKLFPQCSIGVHLNLTEFRSLTSSKELAPILDEAGCFIPGMIRKVRVDSSLARAIYDEWTRQVETAMELGIMISHIDSHQHVHTIPGLFPVVRKLMSKFEIRKVRLSRNVYPEGRRPGVLKRAGKTLFNQTLKYILRAKTTDGFTSLREYAECDARNLAQLASLELMVHPGSDGHDRETALLDKGILNDAPIQLISYSEL